MEPRVTVVVPCFNGLPYLKETLESVLRQSLQSWELIVVDNCSSDGSVALAEEFARHEPRISVVRNPENLGMVGNFNRALELGSGPYLKLLCADDLLSERSLELSVACLDSEPGAALCAGASSVIAPDGTVLLTRTPFPGARRVLDRRAFTSACLDAAGNILGEPSGVLMRRAAVNAAGRFNPSFHYVVDWEYWFRLLEHGTLVTTDQVLASFRVHGSSGTAQVLHRANQETRTMMASAIFDEPELLSLVQSRRASFLLRYRMKALAKVLFIRAAQNPLARRGMSLAWG